MDVFMESIAADVLESEYKKLSEEIAASHSPLPPRVVERYASLVLSLPAYWSFSHIGRWVSLNLEEIRGRARAPLLCAHHKLALIRLIQSRASHRRALDLPDQIWRYYEIELHRIMEELNKNSSRYYRFENDRFLKDVGICALKLFPVGGRRVVQLAKLPRRFATIPGSWRFICNRLGGVAPLLETHISPRSPGRFNEEGQISYLLNVGEILRRNIGVLGLIGSAWYLDPEVSSITPKLAYLRMCEKHGGRIFKFRSSESTIKTATSTSKKRRVLYLKGDYLPTLYCMVWPRRELLEWSTIMTRTHDRTS